MDWESKEVIVHTKTDKPTYEEVRAKIEKTGVSLKHCLMKLSIYY